MRRPRPAGEVPGREPEDRASRWMVIALTGLAPMTACDHAGATQRVQPGAAVASATLLPSAAATLPTASLPSEATCALVLERDGPVAAQPAAGAWAPSLDTRGGALWVGWPDYRHAPGDGRNLSEAFARSFALDTGAPLTGDVLLGAGIRNAVLGRVDGTALAAYAGRAHEIQLVRLNHDGSPSEGIVAGAGADFPTLVRSGDVTGLFWLETQHDRSGLRFASVPPAAGEAPLRVSPDDDVVIRVRTAPAPGGFVAAWTQYPEAVWFARVDVGPGHAPRIAWRGAVDSPSAAIAEDELGDLTVVGEDLWLPILKHRLDGKAPDTHVFRVALDGRSRGHVVLAEAPFFAATVGPFGPTLVAVDEEHPGPSVCVRRFGFDGRELAAPACVASRGTPDVPLGGIAYSWASVMHAPAAWAGGGLAVASLDVYDGTDLATLRLFRCAR